jgi:uncharacterized protein YdaU (DUF1376 family)
VCFAFTNHTETAAFMNYYEHHIGDYTVATTHLTFIEDATYSRLLRRYYSTEKPLPSDVKLIQKLIGAVSSLEKNAVVNMLNEFFVLTTDGWRQRRCDHEIKRYKDKQNKAKRNAESRWQGPGESELPSEEVLNSEGFRHAGAMLEKCGRIPDAMLTSHQSPDTKHQSPDSIPQTPINQIDVGKTKRTTLRQQGAKAGLGRSEPPSNSASSVNSGSVDVSGPQVAQVSAVTPTLQVVRDDPADPRPGEEAAREELALQTRFAALVSKEGGAVAVSDVRIRDMVKIGAKEEELIQAITIARETRKKSALNTPINAGYVLAILKTVLKKRDVPDPGELTWWKTHSGIDAKGRELGMQAQGSESYECFKARIFTELRKRKEAHAATASDSEVSLDTSADVIATSQEASHAN